MRRRSLLASVPALTSLIFTPPGTLAQSRPPVSDVVVLVPGITGSILRKDGKDLWAPTATTLVQTLLSSGSNLDALRLTGDSPTQPDLGDGVEAVALVSDIHLVPGFWKIDGYSSIVGALRRRVNLIPGRNYFEFPYDWRRDNRAAAHRLLRASHVWLRDWRDSSGNANAKLIFLAHSMGGLVARYFAECLGGWKQTRRLITFGTPFHGSVNALNYICNGYRADVGTVTLADLTETMRTFTSLYQLLPTFRCFDLGNGALVPVTQAGTLPGLDSVRTLQALAFHREMDACALTNSRDSTYGGYRMNSVVGIFQPTLHSASRSGKGVAVSWRLPGTDDADGDGTVPRISAVANGPAAADLGLLLAESHGALQAHSTTIDQIAGLLTIPSANTWSLTERIAAEVMLAMRVEDAYVAGNNIHVSVQCHPDDGSITLGGFLVRLADNQVSQFALRRDGGIYKATLPPIPPGAYRISVAAGQARINNIFVVMPS